MIFHLYVTSPINRRWGMMPDINEAISLIKEDAKDVEDIPNEIIDEFYNSFKEIKEEFYRMNPPWDRDFIQGPKVFWLPNPYWCEFDFGFCWQQNNNKITFIASPNKLTWIDKDDIFDYRVIDTCQSKVYFIEAIGLGQIKIGVSDNPPKRLKQLSTGSACNLELLGTIPGTVLLERVLHAKFAHIRANGEWFYATTELREYIDSHGKDSEQ